MPRSPHAVGERRRPEDDDPPAAELGLRAAPEEPLPALGADVSLATKVGQALFPSAEAALIADVVARDLPYYDPAISEAAVTGLDRFARATGLAQGPLA